MPIEHVMSARGGHWICKCVCGKPVPEESIQPRCGFQSDSIFLTDAFFCVLWLRGFPAQIGIAGTLRSMFRCRRAAFVGHSKHVRRGLIDFTKIADRKSLC